MTDQQGGINRTNTGKAHQLLGLLRCLRQCLYTLVIVFNPGIEFEPLAKQIGQEKVQLIP